MGLAGDHPDPMGLLRRSPLRPFCGLRGGLDLGPLALLPRHPTRPQGRGTRPPPQRHQSAHRPRLAILAGRRAGARLVFLRRGRTRRPEPLVAGDARAHQVPGQGGLLDSWREARRRIPSAIPAVIRNAGLDYDLIDDEALAVIVPGRYRVVIVPTATEVPKATAAWLDGVRSSGGTVMAVESTCQLPGAVEVTVDGLADALLAAVRPDVEISPPTPDIGFVHRRCGDNEIYFVTNTGPTTRTFAVAARTSRGSYEHWDAASGRVLGTGAATERIELTLHPYEATVVVFSDQPITRVSADPAPQRRLPLSGPWQVAYGDQPAQPVQLPHR